MKFSVRNISIEISFWFAAVVTLLLTLFPGNQAAYCFLFCILHESGHLLLMLATGRRVSGIRLDYFGIKITAGKEFLPPLKDAAIASGGPAVNFVLAAILFILNKQSLATLNLALAFFNLLPVSVLDGGHILSALFPDSKAVKKLSIFCSVFILAAGIAVAVYSKKNFTLLAVALYLLLGQHHS